MKKFISLLLLTTLVLSLMGCGESTKNSTIIEAFYSSTDEVTLEKIEEMSVPAKMLEYKGGVQIQYIYEKTGDANLDNSKNYIKYLKDGEIVHSNQIADYPNNQFTHLYFSNDKNDAYLYMQSNGGTDKSPFSTEEANAIINESIFDFKYMDAKIVSVTEENENYVVKVELSYDGKKEADLTISIDSISGYVLNSETTYSSNGSSQATKIIYSSDVAIDLSPKTGASDTIAQKQTNTEEKLSFSTVDIDGNPVSDEIIKNAKVVMVNFWEPWCGPCVGEMPDLQKLYEKYKEQGLLILGVFSTTDMDDDARQILSDCNISYPVVRADSNLAKFMTDYFPTTVFADAEGNILSGEPVIGANKYEDWEKMIEIYLN